MIQPFLAFLSAGQFSSWNPPQSIVWAIKYIEPAFAIAHHAHMRAPISKLTQGLHALPHSDIDNDQFVIIDLDTGRVTTLRLKPPYKAGALVSQCVDGRQLGDELCHD